jgi:hypothetical protein
MASLGHIEYHKTSSTYTVLLQPRSDTPCGGLSGVAFRFRPFPVLEWVFCILMTAGRCDDHRFSFFFSVLRVSLGDKQVY